MSYELRVTSRKLKSTRWISKVRVQIHELRVQTHKLRVQMHELRVQIHELRVQMHEFKNLNPRVEELNQWKLK